MEFNKAYDRREFVTFLRTKFLPEDFVQETTELEFVTQTKYATSAVKLGTSEQLDLAVLEIKHKSKHDARVGLSKEAFRLLADEMEDRALVIFVPEDSNANYRFSFIEITLEQKDNSANITRTYSNPRRYSYYLGEGIAYYTPNKYLNELGRVADDQDLHNRFSVEVLTKAFYQELSDWHAWAIKEISFPNDINNDNDDAKFNHEGAIRLITRLIFVWFLKQRHLIPEEFFDERFISDNLIDGFNPHAMADLFGKSKESKYYKAILQNLFFAMLNSPITPEGKDTLTERHFRKGRGDFDNNKLMRYESMFKNPQLFIDLANRTVPFLNGGLFDCLDEKDKGMYYDGFSDREIVQKHLIIPDYLFFGEEVGRNIDLSEYYGDANKKKVSARGIIDILKRYNFTVEENTPFDQEVSLDPELLGKVFENLLASYNPETQTTARKQTGSFYTPREIVQYMIDESLLAHLKRTVGKELEEEYRKLLSYSDEEVTLTDEQRLKIMQSLYDCKILDPACGSGAFPMGILQQMVHILNRIDPNNEQWKEMMLTNAINETSEAYRTATDEERKEMIADIERSFDESVNRPDYARKLYLIENCIYGVDIQPIAIQISKLRFFISLVIDQKTNNRPEDNFGIRPLPNLEAKFVAANTLLSLNKSEVSLFDTETIKAKERELKVAKHKIFSAKTVRTKRKYRDRVCELRQEIAALLEELGAVGNAEARQLAQWDMFDQNATSPFFDSEWMFGVSNGFDIVIGNPPYVQLQANGGALRKMYEHCGFSSFTSMGDIYCLFYEKGYQMLKDGGHLCYITSNKWMRGSYGEKLRKLFATKTNPILLVDFAGVKVFESATVETNILIFAKADNQHNTKCAIIDKSGAKNLSLFIQQNQSISDFASSESWVILSQIEQSIKRKIEAVGKPLKDWDIQIYRGVLTGYNEAFIISTEKKEEILSNCLDDEERTRTAEIIRPILRGRDIQRYNYEWADKWLISTFPARHYDIDDFPAIKEFLLSFDIRRLEQTGKEYIISGEKVKARKKTNNKWFETQDSISYWEDFNKPKIIWKRIGSILRFSYDDKGCVGLDSTCFATGADIEYLCCILNSKMGHYLLKDAPKTGTGDLLISVQAVEPIRIPTPSVEISNSLQKRLNSLILASSDTMIREIDDIVYSLYRLSPDEICYIDSLILE